MNYIVAVTSSQISSAWDLVFHFLRFLAGVGIVGGLVALIRKGWSRGGSQAVAPISSAFRKLPRSTRLPITIAAIAAAYLLPMWTGLPILPTDKVDFLTLLCATVVPYVLIALGLNVVVGMAGLLDLGYVGFYAVGAYTVGVLTSKHASWPWVLSLPAAVVVSLLFGVILGAPTLRLRGDYLAIVTLGFGEIIRLSAQNFGWLGAAEGVSAIKRPPSLGFDPYSTPLNRWYWVIGLTLVLIVLFFLTRLENSRVGRAWTAIREDEDAAELMGVPSFTFKLWAFAIGAAIGGLAGGWYAGQLTTIYPNSFDINKSILFIAAVVLGGLGNKWGAVLGGFAVAYLPERFRFIDDKRFVLFGFVLIAMMIFRPQGLLPRRLGGKRADGESGGKAIDALLQKNLPVGANGGSK